MKDLALFILSNLVDSPESVTVEETTGDNGLVTLKIKVAQGDMGKVIGKEGRTIRAIRDIVKILALKQSKYVEVVLVE